MAKEKVEDFKAVYIGSDDYWGYDADTFNLYVKLGGSTPVDVIVR